jgi:hypothetical protein
MDFKKLKERRNPGGRIALEKIEWISLSIQDR